MGVHAPMPPSSWLFPLAATLLFAANLVFDLPYEPNGVGTVFTVGLLAVLFGTVFAAVHHAEVIAERIGEPYGTLLLTIAVTVIEVALIATLMLGSSSNSALARDTIFAVVMIVCNGLVGLCILVGGYKFREQDFQISGVNVYLCVLIVLATITLILPNYTLTSPGPLYSEGQLAFISIVTVVLYGVFVYTQTIRHRDYFIIGEAGSSNGNHSSASNRILLPSLALLLLSLLAVVLLAKKFSVVIEAGAAAIGAPPAFAGLVVASLILLPESVAAIVSARRNDLQKSINLALGSSLATIGLTVPAVTVATFILGEPLILGLGTRETVLLVMTILVSMLTFGTGRTNILFGLVHVLVFAVYVFIVFSP